jgi:hypothetical protein
MGEAEASLKNKFSWSSVDLKPHAPKSKLDAKMFRLRAKPRAREVGNEAAP